MSIRKSRQALNSRLAADYQLKAAKGGYLPRVDLLSGYGREGTDNVTTRAAGNNNHWGNLNRSESSVRLSQMVFDGFATSSEVGRHGQQYVDHSIRVRTAYQKQFSLGERTLLDLLGSENELFSASRRLAEIKNIQLFTQYRIKATMGELLKSQGVVAPLASVVQNDVKPKVQLPGMN